jgi:ribosomal protein S18 acetylase RimI-like enzyme
MTLTIRTAHAGDLASIAGLHATNWRLAYRGILSDRYLDHELEHDRLADWQGRFAAPAPGQFVIVAEDLHGTLLGFACAYGKNDPAAGTLVENLHAHPAFRNLGIGKAMLAHLAEWSMSRYPGDALHLWVLSANLPAIGFYQRMGAINDHSEIWDAPDGSRVPELRFTWYQPAKLISPAQNMVKTKPQTD